jgi:hypothetical protein
MAVRRSGAVTNLSFGELQPVHANPVYCAATSGHDRLLDVLA